MELFCEYDDGVSLRVHSTHVKFCIEAGQCKEGRVLIFSTRETSPGEWRAGLAEAASIGDSYADAASVEASGLKTVFNRRVRLTVLRATGLAQVRGVPELFPFGQAHGQEQTPQSCVVGISIHTET